MGAVPGRHADRDKDENRDDDGHAEADVHVERPPIRVAIAPGSVDGLDSEGHGGLRILNKKG
jgi:hypothetical protein